MSSCCLNCDDGGDGGGDGGDGGGDAGGGDDCGDVGGDMGGDKELVEIWVVTKEVTLVAMIWWTFHTLF